MRIAVIGTGAVGGYFGGRLAQAGHDVIFVARGRSLEALLTDGLRVRSVEGDFEIMKPHATDDPSTIKSVDVVLICVKAPHVVEAAGLAAPLVGPGTVVIPLQNGLEAPELVARALGRPDAVLGGLCKIFATRTAPGVIDHSGLAPVMEFGELGGEKSARVERIRQAFESAYGMSAVVPDSILAAMWRKLLYVEPLGAVGAVSRQPAGVVRTVAQTRALLEGAGQELLRLAAARGVALDQGLPADLLARVDELPFGATTSMHRDIAAGVPSELEFQTGVIVRYAAESGVAAPIHSTIYAALLPGELRARGELAGGTGGKGTALSAS